MVKIRRESPNMTREFCCTKKYSAFTLAELLVSVLIISIIMVVLAPVITKRVTSNINVSGGGSTKKESKLFLYNPTDPNCSAVAGQNALDCNFTTGSGVKSVNVVMVSGGGGGDRKSTRLNSSH